MVRKSLKKIIDRGKLILKTKLSLLKLVLGCKRRSSFKHDMGNQLILYIPNLF